MQLEKEFLIGRAAADLSEALRSDATLEALFPNTRIEHRPDGTVETRTPIPGIGSSREIRFVISANEAGRVRFSKVCDGNIWRSLEGEIRVEPVDERASRVVLELHGSTRTFVPEITIRVPMREQIAQMAKNLRAALERRG